MEAYQAGTLTLKSTLEKTPLNKVQETMDALYDTLADAEQVNESLNDSAMVQVDSDELEKELDDMLKQESSASESMKSTNEDFNTISSVKLQEAPSVDHLKTPSLSVQEKVMELA